MRGERLLEDGGCFRTGMGKAWVWPELVRRPSTGGKMINSLPGLYGVGLGLPLSWCLMAMFSAVMFHLSHANCVFFLNDGAASLHPSSAP